MNKEKYIKENKEIIKIINEFKKEYYTQDFIFCSHGLYHGGNIVISVTLTWDSKQVLPEKFQGIPVKTLYTHADKRIISLLGGEYDELGEYFDLHYEDIVEEVKEKGLDLSHINKDSLVNIIKNYR